MSLEISNRRVSHPLGRRLVEYEVQQQPHEKRWVPLNKLVEEFGMDIVSPVQLYDMEHAIKREPGEVVEAGKRSGIYKVVPKGYPEPFGTWQGRDELGKFEFLVAEFETKTVVAKKDEEIALLRQKLLEARGSGGDNLEGQHAAKDALIAKLRRELQDKDYEIAKLRSMLDTVGGGDTNKRGGGDERGGVHFIFPGRTNFKNMGNTCFFDSALQALLHCMPLLQRKAELLGSGKTFNKAFIKMADLVWSDKAPVKIEPRLLFDVMLVAGPEMGDGQQHDAQRALELLLTMLHDGCNTVTDPPPIKAGEFVFHPGNNNASDQAWATMLQRQNSPIVQLFTGQQADHTQCLACGLESMEITPFTSISLPLPSRDTSSEPLDIKLSDCLRLFGSTVKMGLEEKWKGCGCRDDRAEDAAEFTEANRWSRILKLPDVLIFHLKRFYVHRGGTESRPLFTTHKRLDGVSYPVRGLDMSHFVPGGGKYDLKHRVVHNGRSLERGHYNTISLLPTQDGEGQWVRFDDLRATADNINNVGDSVVDDKSAYILIYERRREEQPAEDEEEDREDEEEEQREEDACDRCERMRRDFGVEGLFCAAHEGGKGKRQHSPRGKKRAAPRTSEEGDEDYYSPGGESAVGPSSRIARSMTTMDIDQQLLIRQTPEGKSGINLSGEDLTIITPGKTKRTITFKLAPVQADIPIPRVFEASPYDSKNDSGSVEDMIGAGAKPPPEKKVKTKK